MHGSLLLGVATVFVLGLGAQWIGWRFRLPSILLLLVFGFVAGPVTHLLDPAALQGDWVFTFASVSVGIILFEDGLSLRLDELHEVRNAVRNLITIGVAITGVLAALGAHFLIGFDWPLAIIIGSILTVTGPTVVILLFLVRTSGTLRVFSENPPTPEKGDRLIALVGPVEKEGDLRLLKETMAGNSLPSQPGIAQGDGSPPAHAS